MVLKKGSSFVRDDDDIVSIRKRREPLSSVRIKHGSAAIDCALPSFRQEIIRSTTDEIFKLNSVSFTAASKRKKTAEINLLTSMPRADNQAEHCVELIAALSINFHNPSIDNIYVMLEVDSMNASQACNSLSDSLTSIQTVEESIVQQKLICIPVLKQPTYWDFFLYANEHLDNKLVLLANTDIAFDSSLSLIDVDIFKRENIAYVLSVLPPPYAGSYSKVFGQECETIPRCTLGKFDGWDGSGNSWDAYLFLPPLQDIDPTKMDHVMNTNGGENRAGYQLEVNAHMKLYNPCRHIHAFHWHCIGAQMHGDERADHEAESNIDDVAPCWDCPGLEGVVPSNELCEEGLLQNVTTLQNVAEEEIRNLFLHPEDIQICVQKGSSAEDVFQVWTNSGTRSPLGAMCHDTHAVNCIISHGGRFDKHRHY